jgi:hypothetical protein
LSLFLFSSCTGKENSSTESADKLSVTVDFTSTSSYSDKGIVYTNDDGILYFCDTASGYETSLCSKPNCKHQGVSSSNPTTDCDGYVEGSCYSPAVYNDNLYFLYTPETKESKPSDFATKVFCS